MRPTTKNSELPTVFFYPDALRDDFRPDSDVDMLVEFEPAARVGLIKLAGLELELGEILGRKVDLNTPEFLSKYDRTKILAEAEFQYTEACGIDLHMDMIFCQ